MPKRTLKAKAKTRCIKINTQKYRERPGPPYHAGDCKRKAMKGNDGTMYISLPDSRGLYKWSKIRSRNTLKRRNHLKGKKYEILDNGGVPFLAYVTPTSIQVVKADNTDKTIINLDHYAIFIGDNDLREPGAAPKGQDPGNSILFKISANEYIYVGAEIYKFKVLDNDRIKKYYSPVGNSAVPYPYAVGEKYVYFMLDKKAVPKEQIDLKKDAYPQFYFDSAEMDKLRFPTKMIHKRLMS
jgi:hypothetical protein